MRRLAVLTLAALPAQLWGGALADFDRLLEHSQRLAADFAQTTQAGAKQQQARGRLSLERPNRFRWDYQQPEPQTIVGDGQSVWIYDPDLNQVTVKNQQKTLGDTPAALLAGDKNIRKLYNFKELPSENGISWLEASPKTQGDSSYRKIRLGFANQTLRQLEFTDFTGQSTRIELSNVVINPGLPAQTFRFTPPKGADVLRDQ